MMAVASSIDQISVGGAKLLAPGDERMQGLEVLDPQAEEVETRHLRTPRDTLAVPHADHETTAALISEHSTGDVTFLDELTY